ncbi:hypothetical protein [Maridesulfovibrio ferrireducens]|uniref:hypothetical protein n=1 Tax=Maridesulfovibrio ferrireducens TaxID=246191 RepID=UPI001A24AAFB|nr:hypothetical protein [Maridesulfovibrio ferrireducens]MBI9110261.1 hypothetical protein [Maridesulfovibrio ferrireducens]
MIGAICAKFNFMKRSEPFPPQLISQLEKKLGKNNVAEALSVHPASFRRIKASNRADSTVVKLAQHIANPEKFPLPCAPSPKEAA